MQTREASALDLFTDSVRIMGDATLCAVMAFDTRLDARVLSDAAYACLLAHPILHSRLVRGNGPAFWEMIGPGSARPIRVEECDEHYHSRVLGHVDPYGPCQCRVRLLRRPSVDLIVINLSHAAADAFGLHTLMSQLLEEYMHPGTVRPATGRIPERDTLWTRELYRQENAVPSDIPVNNPLWPDPIGTSGAPITYHRESVCPADLAALRARVRSLGGTINDAVIAAYFLALTELTGHTGPIDLFFPINLRQHLKDGSRVMSNQSTNVGFVFERREHEGMETILPRIIAKTRVLKARGIGIAEQVGMDAACDPEGRHIHRMVEQIADLQKTGLADIFLSNPGPFTLPDISGLSDAYICYPGGYMPTTSFVVSTFRGRMTITMGYQDSVRAKAGTRKALDLFKGYLLSVAEGK